MTRPGNPRQWEQWAVDNEAVAVNVLADVRTELATTPRAEVMANLALAFGRFVEASPTKLAAAHAAVLVLLAEARDEVARLGGVAEGLDQEGERYRLAWASARRRAQGLRIHAETVETERDGLRQALHDWIADSDDARVVILRNQRNAALAANYELHEEVRQARQAVVVVAGRFDGALDQLAEAIGQRDEARYDLETLRALHKDLDDRYVLALLDQSQAMGERDALRRELETAHADCGVVATVARERQEAINLLVAERDEARTEVVRLGRELDAVRGGAAQCGSRIAHESGVVYRCGVLLPHRLDVHYSGPSFSITWKDDDDRIIAGGEQK